MKRLMILVCLALLIPSCGDKYPLKVEFNIVGTNGLKFSGSYGNVATSTSVDGTVPVVYATMCRDENDIISCVFQKDQEEGTLTVNLLVDGSNKNSGTTSAAYGIITLTWSP